MGKPFSCEKTYFRNREGISLAGLLYDAGCDTAIIVCHGFTGTKEGGGRAESMAVELAKRGYSTLLFDFAGCGESGGEFSGLTLTRHIADIASAVDFCLSRGCRRVITVGRSFGGAAAVCHGGKDGRVAGVCAWAAPARLGEIFSGFKSRAGKIEGDLVPLSGEGGTVYLHKNFFADLEKHDVPGAAALLSPRPLLVLHGDGDTVVPPENARILFRAAGEPKELKIIPGADHQFRGRHEEAWETLFGWLRKHFPV